MTLDPDLQKLLAPMVEREVSLDAPELRVDRARVLERMARAGGRRWWRAFFAVAVAVALVLVVGSRLWTSAPGAAPSLEVMVLTGRATQARGGSTAEVPRGGMTRLAAEGELETAADAQARVRTTEGVEVELRGRTRIALGELGGRARRVTLLAGAVRCTVPHRAEAPAFQVVTGDVTVVDLGTVFTVSVDEAGHATRVSVEEGEVLVQRATEQTRVHAPDTWSRESAGGEVPPPPAPSAAPSPPVPPAAKAPRAIERAPRGAPAGTLDQEARLLRTGLAAERQGRPAEASAALRELLGKFPRSPLADDARAALERIEAGAHR